MKYMLLGFLLLMMNPLLGADEDAAAPVVRQVRVVCSEISQNAHIKISYGMASYAHSFPLDILQAMDKSQIDVAVVRLLAGASASDELSVPQKTMISILASDRPKIDAIVEFLFNQSRRVFICVTGDHFLPPWGKSH